MKSNKIKLWTIINYQEFIKEINNDLSFILKENKILKQMEYDEELLNLQDIIDKYIIFYCVRYGSNTDYGTTGVDQDFIEIKKEQILIYNNKPIGIIWDYNNYIVYAASFNNIDFPNTSDQSDNENYIGYCVKLR